MKYDTLLKGLDAKEVYFSQLNNDLRCESEFFSKRYEVLELVKTRMVTRSLAHCVAPQIKTGHTPSMTCPDYYGGNIRFVKTDNLRNYAINEPFTHYLTEMGDRELAGTRLQEHDVITTIIGATYDVIARSSIVTKELLPANINQNIALIRANDSIDPYFLCAYMNCRFGKLFLEHLSRQTEQVNLNCEEVGSLCVPVVPKEIEKKVANIVKSAYAKREEAAQKYCDAEKLLSDYLKLSSLVQRYPGHCEKSMRESFGQTGRLDAEYYSPRYDACLNLIRNCTGNVNLVGKACEFELENYVSNEEELYKYVELSNIGNQGNITGCSELMGYELPSRAKRRVRTGDVIVSSVEGSLSSCAVVPPEYDGALCSTGFYVLRSDVYNSETLLILFKSFLIQSLMKKGCSGTILASICVQEMEKIELPHIDSEVQTKIAGLIQKSYLLRLESDKLIQEAQNGIESFISATIEKCSDCGAVSLQFSSL